MLARGRLMGRLPLATERHGRTGPETDIMRASTCDGGSQRKRLRGYLQLGGSGRSRFFHGEIRRTALTTWKVSRMDRNKLDAHFKSLLPVEAAIQSAACVVTDIAFLQRSVRLAGGRNPHHREVAPKAVARFGNDLFTDMERLDHWLDKPTVRESLNRGTNTR